MRGLTTSEIEVHILLIIKTAALILIILSVSMKETLPEVIRAVVRRGPMRVSTFTQIKGMRELRLENGGKAVPDLKLGWGIRK